MNTCPACSQPVAPNELTCPNCAIGLHPGTATSGPASDGKGLSVVVIVIMGLIGIVFMLGFLVPFAWFLFPGPVMPPRSPGVSYPAGSTVTYEEEMIEVIPEKATANEPSRIDR